MTNQLDKSELDLSHLKEFRHVLRWSYDHGLLKGEFPSSDSGSKQYILDEGEKRLKQLIDAYALSLSTEAKQESLSDLRGWIDRNHYQPVNDSDRWVQASGEIITEIDDRIAELKSQEATSEQ
jgi:hypothetical protein